MKKAGSSKLGRSASSPAMDADDAASCIGDDTVSEIDMDDDDAEGSTDDRGLNDARRTDMTEVGDEAEALAAADPESTDKLCRVADEDGEVLVDECVDPPPPSAITPKVWLRRGWNGERCCPPADVSLLYDRVPESTLKLPLVMADDADDDDDTSLSGYIS